jgi:hypothetical protein
MGPKKQKVKTKNLLSWLTADVKEKLLGTNVEELMGGRLL